MKKIGKISLFVVFGLMVLLFGTIIVQGQEDITGTVTDTDGNPISGATVTIVGLGASVNTGVTGAYTIQDVPVGTYTVQVEAGGYVTAEQSVTIVENVTTGAVGFTLTETDTEEEGFPWIYIIIPLVLIIVIGAGIAYYRSKKEKELCGKTKECPTCKVKFSCTKERGHDPPCDEIPQPHPCTLKCPRFCEATYACGRGDCGHGGPHDDIPKHPCIKMIRCPNPKCNKTFGQCTQDCGDPCDDIPGGHVCKP